MKTLLLLLSTSYFGTAFLQNTFPEYLIDLHIQIHQESKEYQIMELYEDSTLVYSHIIDTNEIVLSAIPPMNERWIHPNHLYTIRLINGRDEYHQSDQFSTYSLSSNTKIIREIRVLPRCTVGRAWIYSFKNLPCYYEGARTSCMCTDVDRTEVKEIAELIKNHPDRKIRVLIHTDIRGSTSANHDLSERRASQLRETMINYYKINCKNVSFEGMGESDPIYSEKFLNRSDISREQKENYLHENRRVEVLIDKRSIGQVED